MTRPPECIGAEERGLPEAYVAGTLREEDEAPFEEHLVTCLRCQEAVRLAAAIRAASPGGAPRSDARAGLQGRPGGVGRRLWVGAAVVVAAAVALVLISRAPTQDPALARLGGVGEAPVYLGVPVRSDVSPSLHAFDEGMAAYDDGRYLEAALLLAEVGGADDLAVPGSFFLGVSLLLSDRPGEAAEALRRVIDLGETPYRAEASYYLAKALLRLGSPEEATAALESVAASDHPFAGAARALADSVREVVRR